MSRRSVTAACLPWSPDQQRVLAAAVAGALLWCGATTLRTPIEVARATPLRLAFSVDINAADWPELRLLPRIGEVTARRIVEFRGDHGPFGPQCSLQQVPGIGPKTMARIEPWIRPVPPPRPERSPARCP